MNNFILYVTHNFIGLFFFKSMNPIDRKQILMTSRRTITRAF